MVACAACRPLVDAAVYAPEALATGGALLLPIAVVIAIALALGQIDRLPPSSPPHVPRSPPG